MKALIVDDEPTARMLLSRILQREVACEVAEATNGIEALDALGREAFDFVVIDVMMPLMDGLETLEVIRATPTLKHLPVMVLSAVRDEAQVRRLVALGVGAYLTKPLRVVDAADRLRRFIAALGAGTPEPASQRRPLLGLADGATILVVDGDPTFRQFVRDTLGTRYTVVDAEGGAQGLRACLASPPAAVLLGLELGAVPPGMFLRKLRSLPDLARVPVVVVGARGATVPLAYADAVIPRMLQAGAFRAQFEALVDGHAVEACALASRPALGSQMREAVEQVFGLMLGIQVAGQAGELASAPAGADLARVVLSFAHQEADIELGIVAERAMSERMSALMRRSGSGDDDDRVRTALQELARTIGGRLQNALRTDGEEVVLQRPVVEVLNPDVLQSAGWCGFAFTSATRDLQFMGLLRSASRTGTSTPAAPTVVAHA